jgi:hypothetical protein
MSAKHVPRRAVARSFDLPGHTPPEQPESSAMSRMIIAFFIRAGLRKDLKMAGDVAFLTSGVTAA